MKLNGWQRLWVVLVVIWLLPVMVFSYELWPTTADVPKAEVFAQLKPDDRDRLAPLAPVGKLTPYTPPEATDKWSRYRVPAPPAGKPEGKGPYTIEPPAPVDIDGHKVQFYEGVSQEEMNQTTRSYSVILHHMLSVKRAAFIVKMFGFWMAPMIGLYLTGWSIAWVRRGFRQVA
jgi:hypothetical protein